jgi:predicted glycosyltransferase
MTYLQDMFETDKVLRGGFKTSDQIQGLPLHKTGRWDFDSGFNSSRNRQHRLSNVKRKRLAVLAKSQRCKPDMVYVFRMAWD